MPTAPMASATAAATAKANFCMSVPPADSRGPKHRRADAVWQRPRPLELTEQREQDQEMEEVIGRRALAVADHQACRRVRPDIAQDQHVDHEEPEYPFVDGPKP